MLRMTRPLQSGVVYINDRREKLNKNGKPVLDKDDKPVLENFRHMLKKDKSPKPKNEDVPVYEKDKDGSLVLGEKGEKVQLVRNGKPVTEQRQAKDENGKKLWIPAEGFEVEDEEYVLGEHPHILEKC